MVSSPKAAGPSPAAQGSDAEPAVAADGRRSPLPPSPIPGRRCCCKSMSCESISPTISVRGPIWSERVSAGLSSRRLLLFMGAVVAATFAATAAALLLIGLGAGLGRPLGDRIWLGNLLIGALRFLALAGLGGIWGGSLAESYFTLENHPQLCTTTRTPAEPVRPRRLEPRTLRLKLRPSSWLVKRPMHGPPWARRSAISARTSVRPGDRLPMRAAGSSAIRGGRWARRRQPASPEAWLWPRVSRKHVPAARAAAIDSEAFDEERIGPNDRSPQPSGQPDSLGNAGWSDHRVGQNAGGEFVRRVCCQPGRCSGRRRNGRGCISRRQCTETAASPPRTSFALGRSAGRTSHRSLKSLPT